MAKRKKGKSKRRKVKAINRAARKNQPKQSLARSAENARRRIAAFSKRPDAELYDIPDSDQFRLVNLRQRIANGETEQQIIAELESITSESIIALSTPVSTYGYKISQLDYRELKSAVEKANAAIEQATNDFSEFADIMPAKFDLRKLSANIVDINSLKNQINDLSVFTPENLVPTGIDQFGTAGTIAEKQYYENILQRENERRAANAANQPTTFQGFFRIENMKQQEPIDIYKIQSFESLRKKAATWSDSARTYRANLFLRNYVEQLNTMEAAFIINGFYNDTISDRFDYIRDVINQLWNKEELITILSSRIPGVDISLISGAVVGEVDFAEIYNAWSYFEDEYL